MNKCDEIQEKISALVDGEISESEKAEIEAHIEVCGECRAVFEAFTAVSEALCQQEEIPEGLHEKIMGGIKAEEKKKKAPWKKIIPLAACLVLVIFGAVSLRVRENALTDKAAVEQNRYDCETDETEAFTADSRGASDETVEIFGGLVAGTCNAPAAFDAADGEAASAVNVSAELRELLTPAEGLGDNFAAKNLVLQYTAIFHSSEGDETVEIYFAEGTAYADFGDGPVKVTGTPEEINELLN